MNSVSFHPAIRGAVKTAYALNEEETAYVLTVAVLVSESHKFLTAIKQLPIASAQVGVDFVSKYLGDFSCARYIQINSRTHSLEFYNMEADVKVGYGITLTSKYVDLFKYENANGSQFTNPITRIDLA